MAYDGRPQYGAPSRPYHGAQAAPSASTSGGYGQASYNEQIAPQSYDYYEEPHYAPTPQHSHSQGAKAPFNGQSQQRSYRSPGNEYPEPQYQGQNHYTYMNPTQVRSTAQSERLNGHSTPGSYREYNDRPFQRPQKYVNPQVSYEGSVHSSADPYSVQGQHLESQRHRTPLPRSFTNESVPTTNHSQRRQNNYNIGAKETYHNDSLNVANLQSPTTLNERNNVDFSRAQDRQPKKPVVKERIVIEQSAPNTISWDNPFPTFPINKKKAPQSDSESINGSVASMSVQDESRREGSQNERPQTANSKSDPEPSYNHEKQSTWAGIQQGHNPHPQYPDSSVKNSQDQLKNFHSDEVSFRNRQTEPIMTQLQSGGGARPNYQPQQPGRSMQSGRSFEDHQPLSSVSPNPISIAPQRSNTLPNEVSGASVPSSQPSNRPQPSPWQKPDQQPKSPEVRNFARPYQATKTSVLRNANHSRSQSDDINQGRNDLIYQQQRPLRQTPYMRQEIHGGASDSYYDTTSGDPQSLNQHQPAELGSPADDDIPNFDAIASRNQGTNRARRINQDTYSQTQANLTSTEIPPVSNRDQIQNRGPASDFSRQAHRSRSQPNLKDARQPNTNYNHGFDFDHSRNFPPAPSFLPHPSHQQHGEQGASVLDKSRIVSRNGQRSNILVRRVSPQHNENGHGSPQAVNQGFGSIPNPLQDTRSIRSQDSRGSNRSQGRSPGAGPMPFNKPGPPYSVAGGGMGSASGHISPPPAYGHRTSLDQRRSPGPNLSPSKSLNGPTSLHSTYQHNPDTLPEHPTPVRPGLLQSTSPAQMPKPAPVRQYNTDPSPVQQASLAQPPINSPPPKQITKPVQITREELERLRQAVRANPSDQKTQLVLAKKMVEAASVLADDGGRADQKQRAKNREKYILDAHKIVKKLANHGYPEAMFYLADCHGRGLLGLEADPKEAFNLYLSAAKVAHPQSAYRVAVCCELGQDEGGGTRRDPLKAIQWYKRAATLGDTPAMYKMGMIRLKGLLGQPKYPKEAVVWLKRAADQADEENPHALHELGLLFETADVHESIIKDEAYSKQLFTQAAQLGYKFSQYRLGSAYEYGLLGCPIDPRQSISWYSKAAVQEEHQSELALSGWYLTGSEGVLQQSDTEAYLWARKAAQAGLAKAEYAMGYFSEVGIGAPANLEDAKRWYWRAASQNFPKARERLEDLRKGGATMQKSRVSRSAVNKQSDGDCVVM